MFIVEQLDSVVHTFAEIVGKPDDQARLMLCMYAAYPLGWIMHSFVKGKTPRHLYAIILGVLLQAYMYRQQIYHPLVMVVITYLMMNFLPRNFQHKAVMAFVLLYLCFQHIMRMINNFGGWDMDITTYTMMLTAKLSSVAFCYRDGGKKDEELLPEEREKKIVKIPSVMEMLSYSYFCCGCLVGPFFEYKDYITFIEQRGIYSKIPSTFFASMKRFLHGHICLAIHLIFVGQFNVYQCDSNEFVQKSFLDKVIYYYIAMTTQRLLYYVPWCIIDGSIIACGLGYNGKDPETGKEQFDRILNAYILRVEFGNSPSYMMIWWNRQIHLWLKYYVFNRAIPHGQKPKLQHHLLTFIVSAIWHGFYPFYYIMFFFGALLSELSKDVFRSKILFDFIPKCLRPIFANVFSMLAMNFLGVSFMLLTLERGFKFTSALNHFIFIGIFLLFAFFRFSGIVRYAHKIEAKKKHRHPKSEAEKEVLKTEKVE